MEEKMLTSVTCQVELIPFRLVLMSIGSWFHGTGLFASCVQLFTRYRWSQIAKVEGSNGRGGKKQVMCFKLWEGPERRASIERVEAYCQIKSDRHSPDCRAIDSLTFDR